MKANIPIMEANTRNHPHARSAKKSPALVTDMEADCENRYGLTLIENWKKAGEVWCTDGAQSVLKCYPYHQKHKQLDGRGPDMFCEATNFVIDFSKVRLVYRSTCIIHICTHCTHIHTYIHTYTCIYTFTYIYKYILYILHLSLSSAQSLIIFHIYAIHTYTHTYITYLFLLHDSLIFHTSMYALIRSMASTPQRSLPWATSTCTSNRGPCCPPVRGQITTAPNYSCHITPCKLDWGKIGIVVCMYINVCMYVCTRRSF